MKEQHLDACGLICPLPVLKARKALSGLSAGDILRVRVTDKAAPKDFRLFCAETGHVLKSVQDDGDSVEVVVECRP
ncbi:MAG: sulfurtransferase TusA family protein [Alphaproteobacteria bacterium]|nr:sulfurtransferase TusA family protein [Alphaproteobacteria bacterium]